MKILSTTTTETSPTRTSLDRRVMVQAEAWYNMTETTTSRKTQVDNKSPTRTTSLTSSSTSLHPGQELQRKTAHKTHMDNKPSTGTTSLTSSSTSLHPGQELQRKTAHKTHMDNKPSTGTTSLTSSSTSLHPGQELQRKTAHKTHMDNKPSTGTTSLTSSSALLHPRPWTRTTEEDNNNDTSKDGEQAISRQNNLNKCIKQTRSIHRVNNIYTYTPVYDRSEASANTQLAPTSKSTTALPGRSRLEQTEAYRVQDGLVSTYNHTMNFTYHNKHNMNQTLNSESRSWIHMMGYKWQGLMINGHHSNEDRQTRLGIEEETGKRRGQK